MQFLEPTSSQFIPSKDGRNIAVMMSGGVDSSLAALLLKESGWNAVGVTMKIPVADKCSLMNPCCGTEAAGVCDDIGIPHYFVDVDEVFNKGVVEPFRKAYLRGLTPNPCIDCNTAVKFHALWDLIEKHFGIDHVATGHYARVIHEASKAYLAVAADPSKDQSYFIYGVPRERLPNLLLPLGEWEKADVREEALRRNLSVAEKPDSMELCFAGEGDYRRAFDDCKEEKTGSVLDCSGNEIGQHQGISNYTVGQRKRIPIQTGTPLFVIKLIPEQNAIVVGTREEAYKKEVEAEKLNLLVPEMVQRGKRLLGKIRSYHSAEPCTLNEVGEDSIAVEFDEPQFAPTPGQHLVLYDNRQRVIVGGTIC